MANPHDTQLTNGALQFGKTERVNGRLNFGAWKSFDERADPDSDVPDVGPGSSAPASDEARPENGNADIADQQPLHRSTLTSRPLPPLPGEADMAANNTNAFPPLENSLNSPRSPAAGPGSQVNGNGNANGPGYASSYIPPLPVGHQQDLTFLYQQIQELSGILQSNRDRVNDVTKSAEEVAVKLLLL